MKFEIPFSEDISRRQMKLRFELVWNKFLKKQKTNLIAAVIAVLLGSVVIYGNDNIGFVMLIMGLFGLYSTYRAYSVYQENKKRYENAINDEIEKSKMSHENSIWEFHDEYFGYKDYKYDLKIKWEGFISFRIIEDNIFLDLGNGSQSSYILAKEEVGEESFQNLIEFLEPKLKRTSH